MISVSIESVDITLDSAVSKQWFLIWAAFFREILAASGNWGLRIIAMMSIQWRELRNVAEYSITKLSSLKRQYVSIEKPTLKGQQEPVGSQCGREKQPAQALHAHRLPSGFSGR